MAVAAAMVTAAASASAATSILNVRSSCRGKQIQSFHSSSLVLPVCRTSRSHLYVLNPPHLGSTSFSAWNGLKHLGIYFKRTERSKGKCRRGLVVHASLFGVGAPEALVIGVVALLVFGPKGLAEVARTLGKTLRAFQPTIRELQDVSKEFKSTLEREIGLDEVQSSLRSTYTPSPPVNENSQSTVASNGAQPTATPYSSEDLLKITEEQLASSTTTSQLQEASAPDQSQTTEGKAEISSSNAASIDYEVSATQEVSVTPATPKVSDATPENQKSPFTMAKSESTAGSDQDPNETSPSS